MKKNIWLISVSILYLQGQSNQVINKFVPQKSLPKKDVNCTNYDLAKSVPSFRNGTLVNPYESIFDDIGSVPVSDLAVRQGNYIRTIALSNPEAGYPVDILPGPEIQSQPVEQIADAYVANYRYNFPVGYSSSAASSVAKSISTNGDLTNFSHSYQQSLNNYYGNSTVNNRGSLTVGN
jgi:hypothetical protein